MRSLAPPAAVISLLLGLFTPDPSGPHPAAPVTLHAQLAHDESRSVSIQLISHAPFPLDVYSCGFEAIPSAETTTHTPTPTDPCPVAGQVLMPADTANFLVGSPSAGLNRPFVAFLWSRADLPSIRLVAYGSPASY